MYEIQLHQVAVAHAERAGAARVARWALEASLGGPAGVMETARACADVSCHIFGRLEPGAPAEARAALDRWATAVQAALDAIHMTYPAVIDSISGPDLEEVLGDEFLLIAPATPAHP